MKKKVFYFIATILLSTNLFGQTNEIIFEQITEKLYKIYYQRPGYTTNMLASVGDDGLLLIDTGQEEEAEDLKKAILGKWNQLPKIIINTHEHVDHTGGNAVFGKDPVFIADKLVRRNLTSGGYIFDEFPEYSLPEINFSDSLTLYFNGEEIKLISFPGSHSQNDIIVWFKESNVICIGDLAYKGYFPSYDDPRGVLKFSSIVQTLYELVPDDIIMVPGHYDNMKKEDLPVFKEMLDKTIDIVLKEYEKGKTKDDLIKEDILKEWNKYGEGYMPTDMWIEAIIQSSQDFDGSQKIYFEELYHAYKSGDLQNIELTYYDLKNNHYDEYFWGDGMLAGIGQKLLAKGEYEAAIVFIKLELKEYPNSDFAYYDRYLLGRAYAEIGDKKAALKEYKKALKLNSEFKAVKTKIEELESTM